MSRLTPNTREALLLHAIEGFHHEEIGAIMQIDAAEAAELIEIAQREMANSVAGRIMVIEDEAIIAMDIVAIVREMGHGVTGIARTRTEAVALAAKERPDLILADIQLADNSSGIDAVNDIRKQFEDIPVIFVTAFPERLLTGKRPEPAFLITKPYSEDQVRSAVSQAMFFSLDRNAQRLTVMGVQSAFWSRRSSAARSRRARTASLVKGRDRIHQSAPSPASSASSPRRTRRVPSCRSSLMAGCASAFSGESPTKATRGWQVGPRSSGLRPTITSASGSWSRIVCARSCATTTCFRTTK